MPSSSRSVAAPVTRSSRTSPVVAGGSCHCGRCGRSYGQWCSAGAADHPKVHCLHFPSKPRGNTVTRVNTEPDTPDAHCLHCLRYPPCTVMARGSSPSTATSTYAESGSSPCPVKCPALGAACSAPKPSAASLSSASSQKPDSRFYQTVGFADGDGRLKARWMA